MPNLELDQAQPEVVCPSVHLSVELLADKPEEVEHDHLPDVADLVPEVCIAQHSLLQQRQTYHISDRQPVISESSLERSIHKICFLDVL